MKRRRIFKCADLFCGAGGTTTGAEKAIQELGGELDLVAVNHWNLAIETHKQNHPTARHYVEDVSVADPYQIVPEGYLDLLMASPECRFYSRARGGRPVHDQGRMNPWAIHRWLTSINVRRVLVENVPEFVAWGPLLADGTPDPKKKGVFFAAWFKAFHEIGYRAEWKMLNAADYGDATTRIRFFLIARKDRRAIRWPEASHSPTGTPDMFGTRPKWRAAREIIEWSNPGRSLLDDPWYQRRPLSEKTRRRIARGLEKFGGPLAPLYINLLGLEPNGNGHGDAIPQAFTMGKQSSPSIRGVDRPIPTVTTDGAINLIEPVAEPFILGQQSCSKARSADSPIPTVASAGAISIVNPALIQYNGKSYAGSVEKPVPTIPTKDRFALATPTAEPFIVPQFGEAPGQAARVHSVDEPAPAVTSHGAGRLVSPFITPYNGDHKGKSEPRAHNIDEPLRTIPTNPRFGLANPLLVEVNHGGDDDRARSVDEPLGTVTGKRGTAVVQPFTVQWDQQSGNGSAVRSVELPLPTIITKQNTGLVEPTLGLVEPILKRVEDGEIDPQRLILIDGEPYLLDIRFRMLSNLELARAMSFSDEEYTYEFAGNISEVTKQIGNAVPVRLAKALVLAILKP